MHRREFHRIRQQVPNRLLEPMRIGADHQRRSVVKDLDRDALGLRSGPDHIDGQARQRGDVDILHVEAELAGDDARDVEQIFDHPALRCGVPLDRLERSRRPLGREDARAQHLRPAEHGVDRRPQLVGHGGEELVLRPVRLLRLRQQFGALLFEMTPRGDVERDAAHADRSAHGVAKRPHVPFDPEQTSITADPPQLDDAAESRFEQLMGLARHALAIVGVQDVEPEIRVVDEFVGPVAQQPKRVAADEVGAQRCRDLRGRPTPARRRRARRK